MTFRAAGRARAACALVVCALVGCSAKSGSDDGGGGGNFGALNLNQANMEYAASVGARIVDTFPPLADLLIPAFVALADGTTGSGEVRALAACSTGDASLLWTDGSGDGVWSAGDTARVDLGGCRVHPLDGETLGGSLTLTFTAVAEGPPRSVEALIDLALDTHGNPAGTLRGRVALAATSADGEHFGLVFQPSGASVVAATGVAAFELGCFDVRDDPHPALGFARRVALFGVVKTLGKIMSIEAGGRILYGPDDLPGEGQIGLVSLAVPDCAALGVGGGVGDSDRSSMAVIATGAGGEMRLDLYRGTGQLDASRTSGWRDLLTPSALGIVNGTNAVDVAGVAVAVLDLPRRVGSLGIDLVIGELRGDPVPLCSSGSFAVSISPSGPVAAGHVATVTFAGCATGLLGDAATLGGGVTFRVAGVTGDPTTSSYTLATSVDSVDITVAWDTDASRVTGAFRFARDAAGGDVVEQSDSAPGAALTLTEGNVQRRLDAFSIRGARTAAGGFTTASAGDTLTFVASELPGALAVGVSETVSGVEPGPPDAGDLKVTAGDATSVGLHVASGGAVSLALDADGDGVVDATISTTWDALD